jgi:NAD(P)-dependent dehydrogenase (short-subunit alcohol dehydrogenase family)
MATIVLTGATGAVGGAAATALSKGGHNLILVGRNPDRLAEVSRVLQGTSASTTVDTVRCDLSSLGSVRSAAAELNTRFPRIDGIIHSAAVFVPDRRKTSDGFELMFATNHLAPFLLTNLLLERLRGSAPSRVITVSAPSTTEIDFEDIQGERKWSALTQFGRSKMANLLFAYALARRQPAPQITSNVLFPGLVKSGLMKNANAAVRGLSGLMSKSPEAAGNALAWLAVNPAVGQTSGLFYKLSKPDSSNAYSHDAAVQDRLWSVSSQLAGLG